MNPKRILVAGWFSFEQMGATAGDLLSRDLACRWLAEAGCEHDVALAAPFQGGVDWRAVDPSGYSHVVFVCGPFGNGPPVIEFLERFQSCRLVGLNLTMLDSLDRFDPFHLLLERDSSRTVRPDLAFLSAAPRVPVVGVVLVHPQKEYKGRALHAAANAAVELLIASRELAVVRIDTRLDANATGLRTPAEVESLIARMDVVVTTRLHGMVLALKSGVPALVIDPIAGGAKVRRQAETLQWPLVFTADALSDSVLDEGLDECLTDDARRRANSCSAAAQERLEEVHERFVAAMRSGTA